jgi:hypothetical protein
MTIGSVRLSGRAPGYAGATRALPAAPLPIRAFCAPVPIRASRASVRCRQPSCVWTFVPFLINCLVVLTTGRRDQRVTALVAVVAKTAPRTGVPQCDNQDVTEQNGSSGNYGERRQQRA